MISIMNIGILNRMTTSIMTVSIVALRIMTSNKMTLMIIALGIMTLSIGTLGILPGLGIEPAIFKFILICHFTAELQQFPQAGNTN